MRNRICISTDCAADLSEELIKAYDIEIIYFFISVKSGVFRDGYEITADNIFEYMEAANDCPITRAANSDEFVAFFSKRLKDYEEIVHVCLSQHVSRSYANALEAVEKMGEQGKRVHVFDSAHLSTGTGLLVLRAANMALGNRTAEEIMEELEAAREKVCTTFMTQNANYLYRNAKVSGWVDKVCDFFHIRPMLGMQEGYLKLQSVFMGVYEDCALRYIRRVMRKSDKIDSSRIFLTHAGCTVSDLEMIKKEMGKYVDLNNVFVTRASATVSSNSGPRTFGIIYMMK